LRKTKQVAPCLYRDVERAERIGHRELTLADNANFGPSEWVERRITDNAADSSAANCRHDGSKNLCER